MASGGGGPRNCQGQEVGWRSGVVLVGEGVAIVGWAIFMAVIRVSKNRYSNTHSQKVNNKNERGARPSQFESKNETKKTLYILFIGRVSFFEL